MRPGRNSARPLFGKPGSLGWRLQISLVLYLFSRLHKMAVTFKNCARLHCQRWRIDVPDDSGRATQLDPFGCLNVTSNEAVDDRDSDEQIAVHLTCFAHDQRPCL